MPLVNFFTVAQPFIVGAGIPILLASLAITIPVQLAQQSSIAKIEVKLDEARLETEKLLGKVEKLGERVGQSESDPTKLLATVVGGAANNTNIASFAFVDGKLIAFPKNERARSQFVSAGYFLEPVTPTISGFVLDAKEIGGKR